MKILYYDCFAGISGDMNLGAMLDLGVPKSYLVEELKKLNVDGFSLEVTQDNRRGIGGTKAQVIITNQPKNHRHLRHVEEIVNSSTLSANVKELSLKIFTLIALAEAKVHQIDIQKVHFHEVGALDSIADIVGAAICLDYLNVDKIMAAPIQLGGGTVKCEHGVMPVPAPATAEIVKNIPVKTGLVQHEATTPTGAAILSAVVDEFSEQMNFSISKTAHGIGQRDISDVPNVLRVYLIETDELASDLKVEEAVVLACNIDDMNPEHYGYVLDKLLEAGASDAWLVPIIMKKSRPAITLKVLSSVEKVNELKQIIFTHTTSLGIRESMIKKSLLNREELFVKTKYGEVKVKRSFYNEKVVSVKPEFEDCKSLAMKHNISIREVENEVIRNL